MTDLVEKTNPKASDIFQDPTKTAELIYFLDWLGQIIAPKSPSSGKGMQIAQSMLASQRYNEDLKNRDMMSTLLRSLADPSGQVQSIATKPLPEGGRSFTVGINSIDEAMNRSAEGQSTGEAPISPYLTGI